MPQCPMVKQRQYLLAVRNFKMYKLFYNSDSILRLTDGASIPPDSKNMDYSDYLQWLALGNIPAPADVPSQAQLDKMAEVSGAAGVAKEWLAGQQAAIDFVRLTPAEQTAQIDMMTLAQLRVVVKFLAVAVSAMIKRELLP